jgi:hypothetical protein
MHVCYDTNKYQQASKINFLSEKLNATPEVPKSIRQLVYLSKKFKICSVCDIKKTIWDIKTNYAIR